VQAEKPATATGRQSIAFAQGTNFERAQTGTDLEFVLVFVALPLIPKISRRF
jgi:hypothetical protein